MIDFELTEEQKALIDTARRFTKERIIPVASECDKKSEFPRDVFKSAWGNRPREPDAPGRVRRLGPQRSRLGDDHRGARVRLQRHLDDHDREHPRAHADQACRLRRAEEEVLRLADQRAHLGELRDHRAGRRQRTSPACSAAPSSSRTAATCSPARRHGSRTRTSPRSSSSSRPRTPSSRHKGIGAFIVHRDAKGLSVGKHEDKLGQRASDTAQVMLDGVHVPAAQVLAPPGHGFKVAMETFNQTRPDIGAIACGIIRRCLEESVAYAKERKTFGVPIASHQLVPGDALGDGDPLSRDPPPRSQGGPGRSTRACRDPLTSSLAEGLRRRRRDGLRDSTPCRSSAATGT